MEKLLPKSKAECEKKVLDANDLKTQAIEKEVMNLKKARVVKIAPAVALYNQKIKRVSILRFRYANSFE